MLSGYIIVSFIIGFFLVVLGLVIFLRNSKSLLNIFFFSLSISASIWLIANYFAGDPHLAVEPAKLINKLVFLSGGLSVLCLLFFVKKLSDNGLPKYTYVFLNIVILLSTATSFIVKNVILKNNTYIVVFGTLSIVYFLSLLSNFIYIIFILVKSHIKSIGIKKLQVDIILISIFIAMGGALITNALMPVLFNLYGFTDIGSFFISVLIIGISFSMLKHNLFDIRLTIVRSLSYLFSLLILISLFVSLSFVITSLIFSHLSIGYTKLVYITASILLIIVFPHIKRSFDRITNRIFYRDAYDPQSFYDNLNKILISTLEISKLSTQSTTLIEKVIKTQFCIIGLRSGEVQNYRLFGTEHPNFKAEDVQALRKLIPYIHRSIIVTDDLDTNQAKLKDLLSKNNISVLIRLTTNVNKSVEELGYLILGPKKSGNQYNNLDIRILDTTSKELVLAIQNALSYEEIKNFNVGLQLRIEEATRKLRSTNEKLKALDESKDDFISMASHQLRTPLTSVKGYISMVLEGDGGKINSTQKTMLNQAFFSAQRMVYLISDLLNVSRIKSGKFVIEKKSVDLSNMVGEEMGQMTEIAKSKNQTLTYNKPKNFPIMSLDETKTRQVIMNYIDNAIYYTPQGGKIDIILEDKPETVEFRVVDNGIGVPKAEQHHLFTKFYRAENARKVRPDGTGLGLFMAKKVISSEGGAIIFESQEGKGSTFGFTFSKNALEVKTDSNLKPKKTT